MKKNSIQYKEIGIFGITPITILGLVTGNELKAYIALASFQGSGEHSWPGVDDIAKRSSLTPQAVSEAITGLVKKELVSRKRNYGKTNTYKVRIPTVDPQVDSYLENPDNQEKSGNQENSDVEYLENSADGYREKSDDIRKEHIKITIEKNKEEARASDPFDPIEENIPIKNRLDDPFTQKHDIDGARFVFNILYANCKDRHKTAILPDPTSCGTIYQLLISDDKEAELKEKLLQYEHSWWGENKKQPNGKNVLKSWDQLSPDKVPNYVRQGYETHIEYEHNYHKQISRGKEARFSEPIIPLSAEQEEAYRMAQEDLLASLEKLKT